MRIPHSSIDPLSRLDGAIQVRCQDSTLRSWVIWLLWFCCNAKYRMLFSCPHHFNLPYLVLRSTAHTDRAVKVMHCLNLSRLDGINHQATTEPLLATQYPKIAASQELLSSGQHRNGGLLNCIKCCMHGTCNFSYHFVIELIV